MKKLAAQALLRTLGIRVHRVSEHGVIYTQIPRLLLDHMTAAMLADCKRRGDLAVRSDGPLGVRITDEHARYWELRPR